MTERTASIKELNFKKGNGLIPVVAQDLQSKTVLMLAYTNEEALEKTLSTGYAHYWSRSHGRLWKKGETSGNTQRVRGILIDCDHDALLFLVEQKGNVCHMGKPTCFHGKLKEWLSYST